MRLSVAIAVTCLAMAGLSTANEASAAIRRHTAITGQGLGPALQQLAKERDVQLVYRSEVVGERQTRGAAGELTFEEALTKLLHGTGLTYQFLGEKAITIIPLSNPSSAMQGEGRPLAETSRLDEGTSPNRTEVVGPGGAGKPSDLWSRFRLAQLDQDRVLNDRSASTLDAGQDGDAPTRLNEILVTAQKRLQNLQDVPISITAINEEEISRRGLVSMQDYLRAMPGVNQIDGGPGRNAVVIRGITSSPQVEAFGSGPTVGIYLGEVPLTGYAHSGDSADIKLVDMGRVEVLRGPQGTLYGDSSLGGTVRNVPNAPDATRFSARAKLEYSEPAGSGDNGNQITGVLNFPIVQDRLAVRVVGYRIENAGFIDNVAGSTPGVADPAAAFGVADLAVDERDIGGDEYAGGRVSVAWTPTDHFGATFNYITQDLKGTGFPEVQLNLGTYQQARLRLPPSIFGGGHERLTDDVDIANLVLSYDLGWAEALSSTSWIDEKSEKVHDISSFLGGIPVSDATFGVSDVFVQEVRLVSDFEGPLQFVAGLYYQDQSIGIDDIIDYFGDPALNVFSGTRLLDTHFQRELRQRAAFGELSFDATEKLRLTVGTRQFEYDREDSVDQAQAALSPPSSERNTTENSDAIYKANISYSVAADSLLYLQWSQGFRSGRPQAALPSDLCDLDGDGLIDDTNIPISGHATDPDVLDSFELGSKLSLLNRRVSLNAALFRNDWDRVPVRLVTSCNFSTTANAGAARSQGVELEADFLIFDGLRLGAGGSYVDAELTEDAPGIGGSSGDRLPGSPRVNAYVRAAHDFSIAAKAAFVQADYNYVGGFYNNFRELGTQAGEYGIVNLRGGLSITNVFDVEVFVNNLTDRRALTWVDSAFTDSRATILRPRTVGLSVSMSF